MMDLKSNSLKSGTSQRAPQSVKPQTPYCLIMSLESKGPTEAKPKMELSQLAASEFPIYASFFSVIATY